MTAETSRLGMADVVPMSTLGAFFRQIVEGRESDPDTDASVLQRLAHNGLLGEWLGLLSPDSLSEPRWSDELSRIQLASMRLAGTSASVSDVLGTAGVPHVVYKGVATAALLGYSWNLRQSADVDVLVPLDHLGSALEALREAEWLVRRGYHVPNRLRSWAYCELGLEGPGVSIDLHWRVDSSPRALQIPTETLIQSGVDTSFGGATVPTLSPEHNSLVIAVHGTRELWRQGKWILDLARAVSVVDPRLLRRLAEEAGAARSLALGCAALFELAPSAVPEVLRPGSDMTRLWLAMSQRPPNGLTRRVVKARSADSFTARMDALTRSVARQIVPT